MYMVDWIAKLDEFLKLADRDVLAHAGSISHAEAVQKAELEFEAFTAARRVLPSPVEKHFDDAVKNVKQLERGRREKPKGQRRQEAMKWGNLTRHARYPAVSSSSRRQ